ncbi:MAG: TetR/AcrR family transcriptional regulator [Hyphomonadaceae bacterium]|jgi:AcrR family transcriptional regulator|nr:TetR/AcrR family transcriptional regulator [Hyphomonadaceae bacterium]
MDRRVVRTRGLLQHALVALIQKKKYEAITIEEICAAANVGRSTFYAHYTSKDELKRSGLDHLRRRLIDRQKEALAASGGLGGRSLSFSLPLFEHAREHLHLYRALVGSRGGAVALDTIRRIVADLVRTELTAGIDKRSADAMPRELVIQYVVGAYMAVLIWWLDGGAKLPPQRIDAMLRRLATDGVLPSRARG